MKKAIKLLFSVACFSMLSLSACGGNTPPAHRHTWSGEWSSDATNHWHECEVCGAKKDEAAHEYDDDHDTTCECGYVRDIGDHASESIWRKDDTHHWHECQHEGCELIFDYNEHTADLHGFCDTCGEYLGQLKDMPNNRYNPNYENRADFGTLDAGTHYYRIQFSIASGDLIFVSTNMPSESYVFYWKDHTTGEWRQSVDTCKIGGIYTYDSYGYLVITLTSKMTDVYITYYSQLSI